MLKVMDVYGFMDFDGIYLVNIDTTMENHRFNGKKHYKIYEWKFSIAILT